MICCNEDGYKIWAIKDTKNWNNKFSLRLKRKQNLKFIEFSKSFLVYEKYQVHYNIYKHILQYIYNLSVHVP